MLSVSGSISCPPKYCRQRSKGRADRAYVRINGRKIMLGAYGSEESRQRYVEFIGAIEPEEREISASPTVAEVMVAFLEHARIEYRHEDGRPTSEYDGIKVSLGYLRPVASSLLAENFGPKKLKEVRASMIDAELSRKTINQAIGRIVRMFKWAASEEMILGSVYQNLQSVSGLRRGRSLAKENEPVPPVDDSIVDATLEHLPDIVADMVRLQRLTSVRPGEVVKLRPCDVDRSGGVWSYKPRSHKTGYLGKSRIIAIGPRAQEILLRYLARDPEMHCFRPCDSEQRRRARAHAERKIPEKYGNRPGTNRVEQPKRTAGEAYTVDSYRRAIHRACKKAGVEKWSPNQLRHTAATEIRRDFGLEHAQVVLGHSNAKTTEIYAETDFRRAAEVAEKIG